MIPFGSGYAALAAMKAVRDDLGADPQDTQWAVRGEVDDDGTVHLYPLFPADVAAFVAANWDAPMFTPGWSMNPDD